MSTPPNKALAELMEADMQRVAEATATGPIMQWRKLRQCGNTMTIGNEFRRALGLPVIEEEKGVEP